MKVIGETDKARHRGPLPARHRDLSRTTTTTTTSSPSACANFLPQQRRQDPPRRRALNKEEFAYAGGVKGFVEFINKGKTTLHPNIFHAVGDKLCRTRTPTSVSKVAMQWNDGFNENAVLHQQHPQRDGGTHLTGLRAAMTRVINKYIEENELAKRPRSKSPATTCAKAWPASSRSRCPSPSSQPDQGQSWSPAKCAAGRRRHRRRAKLTDYLLENPTTPKIICGKIVEAACAREAARKAREMTRRRACSTASACPANWPTARKRPRPLRDLHRRG